MPVKYWILFPIIVLQGISAYSQTPFVDSLKTDVAFAVDYNDSLTRYSNVVKYTYSTDPEAALWGVDRFFELAESRSDSSEIARSYNLYGIVYTFSGEIEQAVEAYATAIRMYDQLQDTSMMAMLNNNIASLYDRRKKSMETIRYYNRARVLFDDLKDTLWMVNTRLNIIAEYGKADSLERGKKLLDEVELLKEGIGDSTTLGYYELRKALYSLKSEMPDSAYLQGKRASRYIDPLYDPATMLNAYDIIVSSCADLGNFDEGQEYYEKAAALKSQITDPEMLSSHAQTAYQFFKMRGDNERALAMLEDRYAFEKENFSAEADERMLDVLAKYDSDNKEQQIAIQKLQLDQKAEIQRILIIAGAVISAFLVYLIYLARSRKKYGQALEKSLKDKEILLKEIHHRVKNNLQIVSSLLSIQSRGIEDEKALEAVQISRNRVKSMALIHQNLYNEEDLTGIDLKDYIEKLSSSLFNSYRVNQDQITLETDIDPLTLDIDITIPLGLIINELLTNTLKYAFEKEERGMVRVKLKETESGLLLSVEDNGKGIDLNTEFKKESFGIKMIKTFAAKLNATLELSSKDGTKAKLLIKDYRG